MTERFRTIELEILTACDLACFACDRMSDVTTSPPMTVEQVALFVDESLELDWEWKRIRLLGGEPTLHPKLPQMVDELVRYRRRFPNVFLQVLTNGLGKSKDVQDFLSRLGISLHAEAKTKGVTPAWFGNTRIVPLDRDPTIGAIPPCGLFGIEGCGIGLTRHGYFMDGAGATVARVAGFDIGVMHLKDLTWEAMIEQSKVLCRVCGHWNMGPSPLASELVKKTGEVTGKWWTEALARYHESRPKLRIYGERSATSEAQESSCS